MSFHGQKIIPAIRSMKDFEKMLDTPYTYGVFLDMHIGMLKSVFGHAKQHGKKMFCHVDLIQGLSNDEAAAEYICQEIKPYGLISTKGSVIMKARQKGVYATQRAFIIDTHALERSIKLIEKTNPHYIEVLPGVIPKIIKEIHERTGKPIFAGGLIDHAEEVEEALQAGASAITTSNLDLWNKYRDWN
ncbi:glycerol-3-phosphate responsive antiterminator [Falsibacillus albus]|uniref:Glycerol uptake operon antiterminator regulatory protein n=1 Tax=Falsibacillus albus TaxID=2478915 RepID=A0A3L7JLN9_9BACI|nr:glycerol-3-phosphate responsive antiterminator [Falsibacillus albus]RLQ91656.1 glycerol-3-phosphate responsive antiterminator [Falsibacillus albus]